jgi:hypothetical protein
MSREEQDVDDCLPMHVNLQGSLSLFLGGGDAESLEQIDCPNYEDWGAMVPKLIMPRTVPAT